MVKYSQELDKTFSALADPTRRAVLAQIAASGSCSVTELAENHHMTLAGMLKHVRVLEDAGLIRTAKRGRSRICHADAASFNQALEWLQNYRARWNSRLDKLERYLSEPEPG